MCVCIRKAILQLASCKAVHGADVIVIPTLLLDTLSTVFEKKKKIVACLLLYRNELVYLVLFLRRIESRDRCMLLSVRFEEML